MNQTEASPASPSQFLLVPYFNDGWYHDRYHSYDISYFVFFLILFVCVYIVLGSYMWKSRAVCREPNPCAEPHLHYIVMDVPHKTPYKKSALRYVLPPKKAPVVGV